MVHKSETWPMNRENEIALQRVEMRMIGWMSGVRLRDKLSCVALKQRLGIEDIVNVMHRKRSRWYGHLKEG